MLKWIKGVEMKIKPNHIKAGLIGGLILYLTITLAMATNVHYEYDWWSPGAMDPLPGKFASCPACHERLGGVSSIRKNCEDCHVPGKTGPFPEYTPAGLILKSTYSAPMAYYHIFSMSSSTHNYVYEGEEIKVDDQSEKFWPSTTTSTCFGFNPATGEGTCHGISNNYPVDGYYAFNWTEDVTSRWPHEYTLENSNLPDTKDCKYCHIQSNTAIINAWGEPTQTPNHKGATTNAECYGCHVTGNVVLTNFHIMGPEPQIVEIQTSETPSSSVETGDGEGVGGGGGGGSASPRTLLSDGANELTSSTYNEILLSLSSSGIINKDRFVEVEGTLAAPMILTQRYPKPTYQIASQFPRTVEKITGDVYTIAAGEMMKNINFIYESHKDEIVIARGDLAVDSMAAVAYAKTKNVPLLLVKPDELPKVTESAIDYFLGFGKREITIIGGPVAVSKEVEEKLREKAIVGRIYGETRIDTALALAMYTYPQAVKVRSIVITDYENPVIDATLMSYALDAPLLYVKSTELSPDVKEYLLEHRETIFGPTKVVLLGVDPKIASEINEIFI